MESSGMKILLILFRLSVAAATAHVSRQITTASQFPQAVITTPPTLSDNPACRLVGTALYICESLTPTFTALDPTAQAPCLCYSSTNWVPQIFDAAVSLCAVYASTAVPDSAGSVLGLRGFCGSVGDVRSLDSPRTTTIEAGITQTSVAIASITETSTTTMTAALETLAPSTTKYQTAILTIVESSILVPSSITTDKVASSFSNSKVPSFSSLGIPTTTSIQALPSNSFQPQTTTAMPVTTSSTVFRTTKSSIVVPADSESTSSPSDTLITSVSFHKSELLSSSLESVSSSLISSSMAMPSTTTSTESETTQISSTSTRSYVSILKLSTRSTSTNLNLSPAPPLPTLSSPSTSFMTTHLASKSVSTSTFLSTPTSTSTQVVQVISTVNTTPPGSATASNHPSSSSSLSSTTMHSTAHSSAATVQASRQPPRQIWHRYEVILLSCNLAMLSTFLLLALAILVKYVYLKIRVASTTGVTGQESRIKRISSLAHSKETDVDYPSMI